MTTKKVKTDQPEQVAKGEQRQATLAECNALLFAKASPAALEGPGFELRENGQLTITNPTITDAATGQADKTATE